ILLVTLDGREHWVDPTAETEDWDSLPWGDADRVCYVFDGERVSLRRTPPEAPPAGTPPAATGAEPPLPVWLLLGLAALPLPLLFGVAVAQKPTKEDREALGSIAWVLPVFLGAVLCGAFPENARRIAGEAGQAVAGIVSFVGVGAACLGAVLVGFTLFGLTARALSKTALWKKTAAVFVLAAWFLGVALLAWFWLGGVGKDRAVQIFVGLGSALGGVLLLLFDVLLLIAALP